MKPLDETPKQTLERLATQLNQLIHQYDQYFLGNIKIEPNTDRARMKRELLKTKLVQTQYTFQLGQIRQKFSTYCSLWDRLLQEKLKNS